MKRSLASAFVVAALLAITGMAAAGANGPEGAEEKPVIHAAGDHATSTVLARANRNSAFAPNEGATAAQEDDPESLRRELIACLLIMLIVSVCALLGVCYFDHRTARRGPLATNEDPPKPRPG